MGGKKLCSILIFLLPLVTGHVQFDYQLCDRNNSRLTRSCTTQILGKDHADLDSCKVEYIAPNSSVCMEDFGPITSDANIGGVSLRPYILAVEHQDERRSYSVNYTVLNITFTNIKWKTMKFRFTKANNNDNHCRNIAISNDVTINDQSVLYYDCYWSDTHPNRSGGSRYLDFVATDDVNVHRETYYFNMPSAQMLSPSITEKDWKPFVYVAVGTSGMTLHILPPPTPLDLIAYRVLVKRKSVLDNEADETHFNETLQINTSTEEVTYVYRQLWNGSWYFVVIPIHDGCKDNERLCQYVQSPIIPISPESWHICIASISALIFATLLVYNVAIWLIRRHCCKDYATVGNEIPPPPKVLVIYPSANRLHAECVASFVSYLRSEYGFDVLYDGDISSTSHGDPFVWADEAMRLASHVIYIVGPAEDTNLYNSIYDQPIITAYRDVDILLLSILRAVKVSKKDKKDVMNVVFEHSTGELPVETRHDKVYHLVKDWQSFIAHLSKYMPPKKQIMKTEKGRSFLDDLTRAKKLLGDKRDDVIIRCDNKASSIEKKVLL